MNPRRRRALAWAFAAAASGCSFKPIDFEVRRELLSRLPADIPKAATLPGTLLVLGPEAARTYDTTQMAYSTRPHEIAYFARSEWAERPAQMLHRLLLRTLERTDRFRAVVGPPHPARVDYALRTELLELLQDFTQEPATARLAVRVELRDGASERVIAAREIEAREAMAERSPYAGAVAANEAASRLLAQVARYVIAGSR